MVGLKVRDINKDVLMMFVLSYEYSLSFTNVLKIFKISKQYFWTFMEICSPMLKMGVRKASMLRKSVEKIYPYIVEEGERNSLTPREEHILDKFKWFIEDCFTNGEDCFSLEQLNGTPFTEGYTDNDMRISYDYNSFRKNIDSIKYIKIGNEKFYKTSKAMFYIEKYCGDLDFYQINNMSVKELERKIEDGQEALHEKELELKYAGRF